MSIRKKCRLKRGRFYQNDIFLWNTLYHDKKVCRRQFLFWVIATESVSCFNIKKKAEERQGSRNQLRMSKRRKKSILYRFFFVPGNVRWKCILVLLLSILNSTRIDISYSGKSFSFKFRFERFLNQFLLWYTCPTSTNKTEKVKEKNILSLIYLLMQDSHFRKTCPKIPRIWWL